MRLIEIIKNFFINNHDEKIPSSNQSVIEKEGISTIIIEEKLRKPSTASLTPPPSPAISTTPLVEHVLSNHLLSGLWQRLERLQFVGLLFALFSVIFWSCMGLVFKLNSEVHALETLTFSSSIVSLVYFLIILNCYKIKDENKTNSSWRILLGWPGERIFLASRCLLGTLSLASFYSAYRYISMGDATTLRFTSPVFIAIFAKFLVNEPFGLVQGFNAILTVFGVILIGRPSLIFQFFHFTSNHKQSNSSNDRLLSIADSGIVNDTISKLQTNHSFESSIVLTLNNATVSNGSSQLSDTWPGLALALFAAVAISISMISMKKLHQTPAPVVVFWFSLSNVLFGTISLGALQLFKMPSLVAWCLIVVAAFCSCCDQLCIAMALKLENAGAVAVVQALCVVLSFVFSIAILNEPLYWTSALGGGLIFLSVIIMGVSKMRTEADFWRCLPNRLSRSSNKSFDINSSYSKFTNSSLKSRQSIDSSIAKLGVQKCFLNEPYLLHFGPLTNDGFPHHHYHHHRVGTSYLAEILANSPCTLSSPKNSKLK